MRKLLTLVVAIVVIVSLAIVGCAKPAPVAPTPVTPTPVAPVEKLPEIAIRMNGLWPPGTIWDEVAVNGPAHWIEKAVPRAKVTTYPGNALCTYPDSYMAVQEGICDFSLVYGPMTPGAFPLHEIVEQPGLFPTIPISDVVLKELYKKYPCFLDEISPQVKLMASGVLLPSDIHSTIPIRSLDDIQGKILGTTDKRAAEAMKLLGASATLMNAADLYTPLERNVVDGVVTAWGVVEIWRLYEQVHYHTEVGVSRGAVYAFFNRSTWDKFTPEEQDKLEWILGNRMQYATNVAATSSMIRVQDEFILPEQGHELIELSKEDKATMSERFSPMWDEWAEQVEAIGYPGKDILRDAVRLIAGYSSS